MAKKAVDWTDLLRDLLESIGKIVDPHVDVPRFRGVCKWWRFSIPSAHSLSPDFPLTFQSPLAVLYPEWVSEPLRACLYESRLYLVKPLNPSLASTSSRKQGWWIRVEYDSGSRRSRAYDPFTGCLIHFKSGTLNLLNYRVVEMGKAYTFRELGTCGSIAAKVVMSARDKLAAFLILYMGKLTFARKGNEKLTVIDAHSLRHDYIIVYKGEFYSIDEHGTLWRIDSSSLKMVQISSLKMKMVQLSSPLSTTIIKKMSLVECHGSLYLVCQYLHMSIYLNPLYKLVDLEVYKLVDLEVYKLDKELDEECAQWVPIKSLGDHAFFLGFDYSFSILASELGGCKKNCIYLLERDGIGDIFDMENRSVQDSSVMGCKTLYNLPFYLHSISEFGASI